MGEVGSNNRRPRRCGRPGRRFDVVLHRTTRMYTSCSLYITRVLTILYLSRVGLGYGCAGYRSDFGRVVFGATVALFFLYETSLPPRIGRMEKVRNCRQESPRLRFLRKASSCYVVVISGSCLYLVCLLQAFAKFERFEHKNDRRVSKSPLKTCKKRNRREVILVLYVRGKLGRRERSSPRKHGARASSSLETQETLI